MCTEEADAWAFLLVYVCNILLVYNMQDSKASSEGQWCKPDHVSPNHDVTVWPIPPGHGQEGG